jgi:hypothetical protein
MLAHKLINLYLKTLNSRAHTFLRITTPTRCLLLSLLLVCFWYASAKLLLGSSLRKSAQVTATASVKSKLSEERVLKSQLLQVSSPEGTCLQQCPAGRFWRTAWACKLELCCLQFYSFAREAADQNKLSKQLAGDATRLFGDCGWKKYCQSLTHEDGGKTLDTRARPGGIANPGTPNFNVDWQYFFHPDGGP